MALDQNTRTVIATFEDYGAARQAARDLMDNGVPADAIQIDSDRKTTGAGSATPALDEMHESGFSSWWHGLFGSGRDEEERDVYEDAIAAGSALLRATIPADSVDQAVDVLNRDGAVDVNRASRGEARMESRPSAARSDATASIPMVEEELRVGKRAVQRGGVRVYSHIVTEPVERQINLREEHVNVERRKVDREISSEEFSRLKDQNIEMRETVEEPVISKRARVKEEVIIGKEASNRTETVRDNVRHTEVKVEKLGPDATSRTAESMTGPAAGIASQNFTDDFRRHFKAMYGEGSDFESMLPAYELGYRAAADSKYKAKTWDQVEGDLKSECERADPACQWAQIRSAVRYGWEKAPHEAELYGR